MKPQFVPTRLDLIRMFPQSVGAEIGVCRGYFSVQILNDANVRKLYCIDAWEGNTPGEPPIDPQEHEKNLNETLHNLRGHMAGTRVEVIRGRSTDVARSWSRRPLDWVYIDAAHDYANVMADLLAWSKNLKPDGSILGHDHVVHPDARKYRFGVIEAVRDFCRDQDWKLTYLTEEEFSSYRLDRK